MKKIYREELLDKAPGSIYKLIIAATRRALEIAEGSPRLVDVPLELKPTTVALLEIKGAKVGYKKIKS